MKKLQIGDSVCKKFIQAVERYTDSNKKKKKREKRDHQQGIS